MARKSKAILTESNRRRTIRLAKDKIAAILVGTGGLSVIFSLLLIFFYLFYVVFPLFGTPEAETASIGQVKNEGSTIVTLDEYGEVAIHFSADGVISHQSNSSGSSLEAITELNGEVTSINVNKPANNIITYGFASGEVLAVAPEYRVTYPNDKRFTTPGVIYPLGEEPLMLADGLTITKTSAQIAGQEGRIFAVDEKNTLWIAAYSGEESFLTDEIEWSVEVSNLGKLPIQPEFFEVNTAGQVLIVVAKDGETLRYNTSNLENISLMERIDLTPDDEKVTSFTLLSGGSSYLVGTNKGSVSHWFPVRNDQGVKQLRKIRTLREADKNAIQFIVAEANRKVFYVKPVATDIGVYHTTAERHIMDLEGTSDAKYMVPSIRGDKALVFNQTGETYLWNIDNDYPEISLKALWGKVWYEGYDEPDYIWQSSAADSDFESKYSLTPISFGTLKAAFYAMLFAVPLAILGAVYTAYFMSPGLRKVVKPTIEIMEALPTVILGFLAGLWLAPFLETHLPGFVIILVSLPIAVLLSAVLWGKLPSSVRNKLPEGWQAVLLILPISLVMYIGVEFSQPIELWLFDGNMRKYLTNELGIGFDQRNALVVGIAMGFAVIPTVFSITEDAIFSVPKQLTLGSLALGATPWQSLSRVVLLTASPGIFSAVMVGLGRAVGETMIVLMATGNTPVIDMSIFEGMRTLSANIAVEMPESEVGSTHYRVLFLAALVLFVFTFVFNTGAEVVRQRLRRKYSSL